MKSQPIASQRAALLAATVAAFLTPFMGSAINVALPSIAREFEMDAVLLGWASTSYLLAAAIFIVPFGRIADIYGRKRVFSYGIALFTVASLCAAFAFSVPSLIGARVLQGIGSAMIFGTGVAILTSVFPPTERGRVLGINVAAVYLGLSVGPFVGGILTQIFGWRSIFAVNVPLGLVAIFLVLWRLRDEWAEAQGESFDWVGSVLYAVALLALMYGFSSLPNKLGTVLILVGIAGFSAFAWWEIRIPNPVLNLDLLAKNRTFAFSNLAALINYSATSAVTFLVSLYLQYLKGLPPQQAGLVLISQPIVQAALSPFAGRLSDQVQSRVLASAGMMLTATGLLFLIPLDADTPLWTIVGNLMLLGLGFALFSSPNMNAIMGSVEKRFYGVASGTAGTMRLLGQMLSMGITMLLFALFLGRVEITPEVYPVFLETMRAALAVFALLCVGGVWASLARGQTRTQDDQNRKQSRHSTSSDH